MLQVLKLYIASHKENEPLRFSFSGLAVSDIAHIYTGTHITVHPAIYNYIDTQINLFPPDIIDAAAILFLDG